MGRHRELRAILLMLFLIGTFSFNFPIFISTMAVSVFHSDARGFALLTSIMALGTISGALFAARQEKPKFASLLVSRCLRIGVYSRRTCAWILVACGRSCHRRCGRDDVHQRHEHSHATLDRTIDAGKVMALRVGIALGGMAFGAPILVGLQTTSARDGRLERPLLLTLWQLWLRSLS